MTSLGSKMCVTLVFLLFTDLFVVFRKNTKNLLGLLSKPFCKWLTLNEETCRLTSSRLKAKLAAHSPTQS